MSVTVYIIQNLRILFIRNNQYDTSKLMDGEGSMSYIFQVHNSGSTVPENENM